MMHRVAATISWFPPWWAVMLMYCCVLAGTCMPAVCLLPHVLGSMQYTLQWLEWLFNWSESALHAGVVHSTHFV